VEVGEGYFINWY